MPSSLAPNQASQVPVVSLVNVERTFAGTPPVHALKQVTLDIHTGEHLAIVGPSGSGKSTLLNILGLLDRPSGGEHQMFGWATHGFGSRQRAALRAESIGFVFQSFYLLAYRTALENVELATFYHREGRRDRRDRAMQALADVGLAHRPSHLPSQLSGGEQQRVAIARATINRPRLLLADEPTGNLDRKSGNMVLDHFDELGRTGLTRVVITHDEAVASRADRTFVIEDGRLAERTP